MLYCPPDEFCVHVLIYEIRLWSWQSIVSLHSVEINPGSVNVQGLANIPVAVSSSCSQVYDKGTLLSLGTCPSCHLQTQIFNLFLFFIFKAIVQVVMKVQ